MNNNKQLLSTEEKWNEILGKPVDWSDYKQLAEDVWLFLTNDKLPEKATIKKEAFLYEVKTMIECAILFYASQFKEQQVGAVWVKGDSANGLFTGEQNNYVASVKDEDLRAHLLHQVRLRDNMEADRDAFEKELKNKNIKSFKDAIDMLIAALNEDKKEGSYYYAWQANIAMCISDVKKEYEEKHSIEFKPNSSFAFHSFYNDCAKRFLELLCSQKSNSDEQSQPILSVPSDEDKKVNGYRLRPCDCKDAVEASRLNEQGIAYNDEGITVKPNYVLLKMGHTEVKISMQRFKMFAEWYLKEQNISSKEQNK